MAVKIEGEFLGDGSVKARHESGDVIVTVPPKDNRGDGSKFSPTDLAVTSMATCMLTIMSFVAKDNDVDFKGVSFKAEKLMQENPRRISKILIDFYMPGNLSPKMKKKLEAGANSCPVKGSMHPDVDVQVNFIYSNVSSEE